MRKQGKNLKIFLMHCSSKKKVTDKKSYFSFFYLQNCNFFSESFFFLVKTMKYGLVTKGCRRTDKSINRWQDLPLLFLIYRWHDTQFIASRFYSWGCEFFAKHIIFRSMRKLEPHLFNIKKKKEMLQFFFLYRQSSSRRSEKGRRNWRCSSQQGCRN